MYLTQGHLLMTEPQNNLFELENTSLEISLSSASHITAVLTTVNFLRISCKSAL